MRAAPHIPTQGYFDYPPPPGGVSLRILSLESPDYFGTSEYFSGWKKRKKNLESEAICKLSLYANESCDDHAVYFQRWLKWRAMLIKLRSRFAKNDFKKLDRR